MPDPGGETGDLSFPLDTHPSDRRPRQRVERVTLERGSVRGEDDHDRFVFHAPTLTPGA
jgi:hypothetical protein